MTETKFTSGPWVEMRVERHNDFVILQRIDADHATDPVLAMISNDRIPQEVCEANAHLIAAAPDLYEALARAERTFLAMCEAALATGLEGTKEWDIIAGGADIFGAIDEVQAALSKARGERK